MTYGTITSGFFLLLFGFSVPPHILGGFSEQPLKLTHYPLTLKPSHTIRSPHRPSNIPTYLLRLTILSETLSHPLD